MVFGGLTCYKAALDSVGSYKGILILIMGSFMDGSSEAFQLGFIPTSLFLS